MKKILYPIIAIAALSLSLVSCNKAESETPKSGSHLVNFTVTGKVDPTLSKTYIEQNGNEYLAHWSDASKEQIGLLYGDIDENMNSLSFGAYSINEDVATFSGSATIDDGTYNFHPFYPASAFNKTYKSGKIGLTLKREQNPVLGSFDPAADIMLAGDKQVTVNDSDNILIEGLSFLRPMAVLRVNLMAKNEQAKAYGEKVQSVEMNVTGQETDFTLTGNFSYTPDDATLTWNTHNASVKATYTDEDYILIDTDTDLNSAYFVINPTTIPSGTLVFTIETNVHNGINAITRTVTVPTGGMELLAGKVNEINLTVRDKDVPEVVSDTRILVEGFDNVTTNKTQPAASATGVFGSGVSENLAYTYSTSNTNIRFNSNGQTSDNPYLYINEANASLTMSNIVLSNQTGLELTAKVKNSGVLTVKYKVSTSSTWQNAGTISSSSSFSDGSVSFAVENTVTSIDIRLIGSAAMIVDDIVLKPGESVSPITWNLESISVTTAPTKTTYTVGDNFDPTGMIVTGHYVDADDNSNTKDEIIDNSELTITPSENLAESVTSVTIQYNGKSTYQSITVTPAGTIKKIEFNLSSETTGNNSTSYVESAQEFSVNDIHFKVNNWNPSNSQIRGNQGSATSISSKNFQLFNTTAIPGIIQSITLTCSNVNAANTYAAFGSNALSSVSTSDNTASSGSGTISWSVSGNNSYFYIGMAKGGTSGTAKVTKVTIEYK